MFRSSRILVVLLAALLAAVSAGCGSAPPEVGPTTDPTSPVFPEPTGDEQGISREVSELLADDRADDAETLLRTALADSSGAAGEKQLLLLLAGVLEEQGRFDEASVTYARVSGVSGWDGLARLRDAVGDAAGASRASLRSWNLSPPDERRGRVARLESRLAELDDRDLRELEHESRGLPSHELLRRESRRRWPEEDRFRVTALVPLSGRFEEFGRAFELGARLALEHHRAADSARVAVEVELRVRDTEGDLLAAVREAREAILEDGADTILGPLLSLTTIGAGGVAQSYEVPLLSPTATDPELPEIGRYVLTLDPSPEELTRPLANFSVNALGNRRHGVLLARDGVSEALERSFREAVESFGAEVVASVTYDPGERDFRRLIERIDELEVEAVYVPGNVADLEALAPQLEFYEFHRMILGNGAWTHPRLLDGGNVALEGAVFAVQSADDPGSEFMMRLREAVWKETQGEASRFHIRGYQAMDALLGALDQGARGRDEVAELLRLRSFWDERPEGERIHLLTFRDGVLGPASWATGFELTPKYPKPEEEEEEEGEEGSGESSESSSTTSPNDE